MTGRAGRVILLVLLALAGCAHEEPAASQGRPYVLVLGTAQDGGIPQLGCDEPFHGGMRPAPARRRLVASLLLVDPRTGSRWLIDASPDLREQEARAEESAPRPRASGARPPLFDGIFLTHAHMGHYAGLLHFGREAYGSDRQPVLCSASMAAFLAREAPWELLVRLEHLVLVPLAPDVPVRLAQDLAITPFLVPHRAEYTDTFGFRIDGPDRSLLYIPDIDKWERWDRSIEDALAGVDHALLDGTFYENGEIPGRDMSEIPHPFIEESLRRFSRLPESERAKVLFTHLNHTNPAADPTSKAAASIRTAGLDVAADGMILPL